jgi:hypothetical protein
MGPAHERLGAEEIARRQVHERLVLDPELVALQCRAQAGVQGEAPARGVVQTHMEPGGAALAVRFGLVEREVGVAHQLGDGRGMVLRAGDPDAGVDGQVDPSEAVRRTQRAQDPIRHLLARVVVGGVEQDGEFVAAEPGHRVAPAHRVLQPGGDLAQEGVTRGMAERVVDRLEVVEVDGQHGERRSRPARPAQGMLEAVGEQGAIGQARERIVEGLMGEGSLELHLRRDVAGVQDPALARCADRQAGHRGLGVDRVAAVPERDLHLDHHGRAPLLRGRAHRGADGVAVAAREELEDPRADEPLGVPAQHPADRLALPADDQIAVDERRHVAGVLDEHAEVRLGGRQLGGALRDGGLEADLAVGEVGAGAERIAESEQLAAHHGDHQHRGAGHQAAERVERLPSDPRPGHHDREGDGGGRKQGEHRAGPPRRPGRRAARHLVVGRQGTEQQGPRPPEDGCAVALVAAVERQVTEGGVGRHEKDEPGAEEPERAAGGGIALAQGDRGDRHDQDEVRGRVGDVEHRGQRIGGGLGERRADDEEPDRHPRSRDHRDDVEGEREPGVAGARPRMELQDAGQHHGVEQQVERVGQRRVGVLAEHDLDPCPEGAAAAPQDEGHRDPGPGPAHAWLEPGMPGRTGGEHDDSERQRDEDPVGDGGPGALVGSGEQRPGDEGQVEADEPRASRSDAESLHTGIVGVRQTLLERGLGARTIV